MAGDPDRLAKSYEKSFETENTGSGFLAEEEDIDRRSLWRLGSWGVGAVAAVVVAVLANQSAFRTRLDQVASDDLARQAQQLRIVAKESQNEARRLASAVETLNADRDRLYSRVSSLEQGLDSVTGSIARQNSPAATAPSEPASAPVVAPVATTAAATVASVEPAASPLLASPLMAPKSIMAPPDSAAAKLIESKGLDKGPDKASEDNTAAAATDVVGSLPSANDADLAQAAMPGPAVQRTEFAVDVGGANSIGGLRVLWRGLLKSNAALAALRPLIAVKEARNGPGMQLRLLAGPLSDAAAAAKICAALIESQKLEPQKTCETTVFDGQRLAMRADEPGAAIKPAKKRNTAKPAAAIAEPATSSTLSTLLGRR